MIILLIQMSIHYHSTNNTNSYSTNPSNSNIINHDTSNITIISPSHLYYEKFINNTSNNLLYSLRLRENKTTNNLSSITYSNPTNNISFFIYTSPVVQFKNFKTNDSIFHYKSIINPIIVFHDEQTNFIFRITNFISNIISRKKIITDDIGVKYIYEIIEIENSTLTNTYWGTTNE